VLFSFREEIELASSSTIDLDALNILRPFSVSILDSLFIFSNWETPYNVSILNIKNNQVTEAIPTGNGPEEVIGYLSVKRNKGKSFMFANRFKKKVYSLAYANGDVTINHEMQMNDSIPNLFCIAELNPETFISTVFFTEGRFLVHHKNNDYFYGGEYPENEDIKRISSRHKAALYNTTKIGIHPDGDKFVLIYQGLLDIYELSLSSNIKHIKANHYFFPLFMSYETGSPIIYNRDCKVGFIDIDCDDSYIYMLYTDMGIADMYQKHNSPWGNIITVFDWNGSPQMVYHLDRNINSLCVKNKSIWGISPDFMELYEFIIPEQAN
jgi:hypothetical protein